MTRKQVSAPAKCPLTFHALSGFGWSWRTSPGHYAHVCILSRSLRRKGTVMSVALQNQLDPLSTSFRQLKGVVGSTAGKKLPSVKALKESGAGIVFVFEHGDITLTVYSNGFFIYECFGKEVVSAVDRCQQIVYQYQDNEIRKIEETEFRDGPCLIPLLLSGDDRVAHNLENYEWYWHEFSLSEHLENWCEEATTECLEDRFFSNEQRIKQHEELDDALDNLTKRQRQVVQLYFIEEMTFVQIAKHLNLSYSTVYETLRSAMERLRDKV